MANNPIKIEDLYPILRQRLQEGTIHFAYRKKSGELRIAHGTTSLEHIPEESHPSGYGPEKSNTQAYWDLNVGGWRAFNPLCVVWVQGVANANLLESEREAIVTYMVEHL